MNKGKSPCTFYCHDKTKIDQEFIDSLGKLCLVNVPYDKKDDPPFDFGIFFDSLKNNITGPINFPTKINYSFWWGLRNLR